MRRGFFRLAAALPAVVAMVAAVTQASAQAVPDDMTYIHAAPPISRSIDPAPSLSGGVPPEISQAEAAAKKAGLDCHASNGVRLRSDSHGSLYEVSCRGGFGWLVAVAPDGSAAAASCLAQAGVSKGVAHCLLRNNRNQVPGLQALVDKAKATCRVTDGGVDRLGRKPADRPLRGHLRRRRRLHPGHAPAGHDLGPDRHRLQGRAALGPEMHPAADSHRSGRERRRPQWRRRAASLRCPPAEPDATGRVERLTGADGFLFDAWREPAREARRGGLVILHAIWGVTPHLRSLAADFADGGYEVVVPSLFDRFRPGMAKADVTPSEFAERMAWAEETNGGEACLGDIAATIAGLAAPVFVMGFCFGGTAAWLSACRLEGIAAAVCFYGGQIAGFRDETPLCPTMLHFGRDDELIPPADVESIRAAHEDLPIHVYPAGHAFVAPSGLHEDSAALALLRSRAFLHRAAGSKGEI